MKEIILKDYGWCRIIQRKNKYIICYDGGGIMIQMSEIEISEMQMERAVQNQYEAEKVIREILAKNE